MKYVGIAIFAFVATFFSTTSLAVNYYTYVNGGSSGFWNVAGTWTTDPTGLTLTGSAVPGNNDAVNILNGFTVNLNANVTATNLSVNIFNGGVLDMSTFTFVPLNVLSGSGTLRIQSANFPAVTTNNFSLTSGATAVYYDFSGQLPVSIVYPNLQFLNTTASNHVVTFSNSAAYTLTVNGTFTTLNTGAGSMTVTMGTQNANVIAVNITGNVTIGAGTRWETGAFNANHSITLQGDMTNNGTVDFSNTAQYAAAANNGTASLTFIGASDRTLACNGTTDLYTLTVNKGSSSTYTLSVTSTNSANLNLYANGQLIFLTNGTLRLGANINIPRIYGSGSPNYDVGSSTLSPMFWIDGATVDFNSAALVVYGKFRISSGSFTSTGGQGTVIREEGQYIIEGGTFTTEKFRPSSTASTHRGSFTMSGGIFNANGTTGSDNSYARFSHPYPEQVFIMSGGTINVSNPQSGGAGTNGGIHIGCKPSNYIVTGGTFNAILSGSATTFNIASVVPFWNLNILRTGGSSTVRLAGIGSLAGTVTGAQPLVVLNNVTIDGTNSPILDAGGQNVTIGLNFTVSVGATYTPNGNTTTFNGSVDQIFTNNGTITGGLYHMTVSKTGTLTISGSNPTLTVTQTLSLLGGILNDGGKTILANRNIVNQAVHTGTGNITLGGTLPQEISGNGSGVFGNLILNNTSVPGANVTTDITISGVLTLAGTSNSLFDINENLLALTSPSAVSVTTSGNAFSSSKMIRTLGFQSDKGIRKTYGNLTAFTFPFGTSGVYMPATIQINATPTTYGTITARPVDSRHPLVVAGNTNNLMAYWKVTSSGFAGLGATAVNLSFSYPESQVSPALDDVNYVPARYQSPAWTVLNNTAFVDDVANTIAFGSVAFIDGEFTAGVPAAFGIVKTFYSKRNGNWTNVAPGTTPWSNVSHSGPDATTAPTAGDAVFIGDGATFNHNIVITTDNQSSGGLEISSGSSLDVGITTGHNFGAFDNTQIAGSGLLRISSAASTAEFPAGDFGNFIRNSGGTVEYYSTGTQDFMIPETSAAPTGLPLTSYRHLILTPSAGRTITMPNQNERIYANMIVQGAAATGVVALNSTASQTLTIDGNLTVSGGNLQFRNNSPQTIDVGGSVNVENGAFFDMSGSGAAATNTMTIRGSLVNNGTFDLSNTTSYVCNVTFSGASNASVTGAGATTDFNTLTVNKGTSQGTVLDINASAFSLSGTIPLVLVNGTFRLTSSQTVTFATNADFTIGATTRLSANGGTLQMTGANGHDILLSGTLELLSGTINVGTTANDNSIEYASTGSPSITVSGGTLNVRSQIRRSFASTQGSLLYAQSGGTVTIGISSVATTSRGVFEVLNNGSAFTLTGGTISIVRHLNVTTIADLYLHPASNTVSGGTIEIGTGNAAQTIDINSLIPLFNVSVLGSTNTARLESNGISIRGSLFIDATNIFNANSLNVSIAGNLTNLNTTVTNGVTVGGYRPGATSQTTTFNGTTTSQFMTGVSGNLTNFGNLVINNTFAGGTVSLQPNTNLRVNGNLILSNGTFAGSTNTITAISTVSSSSTHTSSGGGALVLGGTSSQLITGNGTGRFGDVVLSNANGAVFGAAQEITGSLTFTNGALTIGSYRLFLSNTSLTSVAGATPTRYIVSNGNLSDGGVLKSFAPSLTNGNFVFPVGVAGKYTPANYTLTTGAAAGTLQIKPVNSKHPNATGPGTAFINYYWNVVSSGITVSATTHTYTYSAGDESGNVLDYRHAYFQSGAWFVGITPGNPNTTTRVITFTNTDLTADYTAGEASAFVNPTTYTSIASGNWDSDLSVWDVDPPGTNLGPPPGSFIIISPGTTVTVTTNTKRPATLNVQGRLNMGATTGHDFGVVSTGGAGERTIQLQSSTFPAGNFTTFTAANGGTIEYDGTVTLPTQPTYNNLTFTGAGIKSLSNVNLNINGNLTILSGTVTNANGNADITLASTTGDLINNGVFSLGTGELTVGRDLTNNGASAVFTAGTGNAGLHIMRNLNNIANATFIAQSDSIGVRGTLNNAGTFNASSGLIRVNGNLNNTAGSFSGSTGNVTVGGSVTNNATLNAGSGQITVTGSYTNSGASAVHNANNNALTLGGGLGNLSGAVFDAGSGTITVGGSWTNTATFNRGSGTVTFNSAGARLLNGTTTFHNLQRTNGGTLTLNSSITVAGQLLMVHGNIITGIDRINLTNTATQPVTGFGATSFIDGRLSISFPGAAGTSRIYPVGKGAVYRPVVIQQTSASTDPVVAVEMINTPPTGTYPASVGVLSEARYYAINLLSGTMNSPTIELNFNTNGATDEFVFVPGNVHIMRATASTGPWTDEGGSGVFSPAAPAGYATSGVTTIANPTFFTMGYQNTLPVTLSSFTGMLHDNRVLLNWTTRTENSNHYFSIERSSSEIHFDSIGFVFGGGNSQRRLDYHFVDPIPLPGYSYYRLKQTDFDGKFKYSHVVVIDNTGLGDRVDVYPNPGNSDEIIQLYAYSSSAQNGYMELHDRSGKVMHRGPITFDSNGIAREDLPRQDELAPGIYLLKVIINHRMYIRKVVIH